MAVITLDLPPPKRPQQQPQQAIRGLAEPLNPPSGGHGEQGFGVRLIVMVRLGRCRSSSFRLCRLYNQMVGTIPCLLLDTYLDDISDGFFSNTFMLTGNFHQNGFLFLPKGLP